MKGYKNLKIGVKMMIGFIPSAAAAAIIGIFSLMLMKDGSLQDRIILICITAGAIAVSLLAGAIISRMFTRPIKKLVLAAKKLAEGDTDIGLSMQSESEVGQLASTLEDVALSIGKLIADADMLTQTAVEGKLSARADAEQHKGDYKKIIQGFNNTLDAFMQPLGVATNCLAIVSKGEDYGKLIDVGQYNGDFKEIMQNLNTLLMALHYLQSDAKMLAEEAVGGNLSARAGLEKHKGGYRLIIEGVNKTLDAVIDPIKEATAVMSEVARGNLNISVTGDYRGDHAVIKDALNGTIDSIKGYIAEISDVLGKMSEGDLSVQIQADFKGDFIQLKDSINTIVQAFNRLLRMIISAADQVHQGALQVSNGNQAISQGAAEQAASIEELSATISGITGQTKENAEHSRKSNGMALAAKNAAARGNEQMREMLQSMEDINESSENISRIIKVIDDIAFQTNILALNAAVEAARAGVHGKGFAVVAEEVRNLAAKSAQAAKETAELIEGSMKNVAEGTKIANETAGALSQIVESVDKTVELGELIAAASEEQAAAIHQVNQGIEQMSKVVQTNSATSQEGAAASEELSGQADLLKQKVSMFKLKDGKDISYFRQETDEDLLLSEGVTLAAGSKY